MKIGIRPYMGELGELNKWYFGIEFFKCNPVRVNIFKPYIMIWCFKWLDFGEMGKLNGREAKRKGFIKTFEFPYGISIEIHR